MSRYSQYCKCTKDFKCEFCVKYARLRAYVSREKRAKEFGAQISKGMLFSLGALRQWFKNTTGIDYNGERPKTYHREKKSETNPPAAKAPAFNHIIGTPISPDTFEFKDNRIFIKDSRDIKIIEINLSTRTISILQDSKYKAMILSDVLPFSELIKSSAQINRIKTILEGK